MTTTAEIHEGLVFTGGRVWVLSIELNRFTLARGGLGKGKDGGSFVGDTLVELLRRVADYMEQEDIEDLDALSVALKAVR